MKIKSLISFFLAAMIFFSFAELKKRSTASSDDSAKTTTNGTMNCVQEYGLTVPDQDEDRPKRSEAAAAETVGTCTAINGVSVVADSNGLRFVDEITGKETTFCSESSRSVLYNGKTVYFIKDKEIEDKMIKIRFEEGLNEDAGDEVWSRREVFKYTVKNEKTEKLFTTNGYDTYLVYFDTENLYYLDVADKNIGYFNAINSGAPSLYKYNFKSAERTLISESGFNVINCGNYLFYSDSDQYGFEDGPMVFPGEVHIYDTKSGKNVKVDDYGDLLYCEDDRFYFIHISEKDGAVIGGTVKSCKKDGSDLKTGISISGEILTIMDNYVGIRVGQWDDADDWIDDVVNVKTGNRFKTKAYSYTTYDDVLLDSSYLYQKYDSDNELYYCDKKIYRIKDDGTRSLYFDLSGNKNVGSLDRFEYKSEFGVYVSSYADATQAYDTYVIKYIKND